MKTLLAGPWVGEFGWELFCWQGHVRSLALQYDKTAVACKPGHEALYEDFADKIILYEPTSHDTNMFMCEGENGNCLQGKYDCTHYLGGHFNIGFPIENPEASSDAFKQQLFKRYGEKNPENAYDIIIHARATNKGGSDYRNYPIERWNDLISKMDANKIACIGTTHAALHIDGTEDLRGKSIKDLTNILASSQVIVGPSSGPMHLATLCGCPQVVWCGNPFSITNKRRYEKYWNPFNTPVAYLHSEDNWDADTDSILESIEKIKQGAN
jgi:ADP-heptose:LPS heptosyltransferase